MSTPDSLGYHAVNIEDTFMTFIQERKLFQHHGVYYNYFDLFGDMLSPAMSADH